MEERHHGMFPRWAGVVLAPFFAASWLKDKIKEAIKPKSK